MSPQPRQTSQAALINMLCSIIDENRRVFPPCRTGMELVITELCGARAATHSPALECCCAQASSPCDGVNYSSGTLRPLTHTHTHTVSRLSSWHLWVPLVWPQDVSHSGILLLFTELRDPKIQSFCTWHSDSMTQNLMIFINKKWIFHFYSFSSTLKPITALEDWSQLTSIN